MAETYNGVNYEIRYNYPMNELSDFNRMIEKITGKPISYLCDTPISQLRADTEREHGRPMQFTLCGKPSPHLLSTQQVEKMLDKALNRHRFLDKPGKYLASLFRQSFKY